MQIELLGKKGSSIRPIDGIFRYAKNGRKQHVDLFHAILIFRCHVCLKRVDSMEIRLSVRRAEYATYYHDYRTTRSGDVLGLLFLTAALSVSAEIR